MTYKIHTASLPELLELSSLMDGIVILPSRQPHTSIIHSPMSWITFWRQPVFWLLYMSLYLNLSTKFSLCMCDKWWCPCFKYINWQLENILREGLMFILPSIDCTNIYSVIFWQQHSRVQCMTIFFFFKKNTFTLLWICELKLSFSFTHVCTHVHICFFKHVLH